MLHVAWSVRLCVSVCWVSCAITTEPIEMPFGADSFGPRNDGQDRTNPFASAKCDKSAMWPFAQLIWTLVKGIQ